MRQCKKLFSILLAVMVLMCSFPIQTEAATVKLNKTKAMIYVGQSVDLKITGTSKKVKWTSSNKKIAIVSSKGKVTGKKAGTATITAKAGKKSYKCKVIVKTPYISQKKKTIEKGKNFTLKLYGTSIKSVSSSNRKIATVDKKGKVTGKKAGKATITLKGKNGKSYKCTVTVKNPIKISKTEASIYEGESITLKITGTNKKVKWTSSNKEIASVSSKGTVTGKAAGTVTITAKVDGKSYKCNVTVKKAMKLEQTSVSIEVGESVVLKVIGAELPVRWSSSNESIATVSSSGEVIGIKKGNTTITATVDGRSYRCEVTVERKNGYQFSTEYKIEDFCNGYFIVSKLNGKLYGVLDIEGNEVIPLKYDDMRFFNQQEIELGITDEIIFYAKYEEYGFTLDVNDKKTGFEFKISSCLGNENIYLKKYETSVYYAYIGKLKERYITDIYLYKDGYKVGEFQSGEEMSSNFTSRIYNYFLLTPEYYLVSERLAYSDYTIYLCKINNGVVWEMKSSAPAEVKVIGGKVIVRMRDGEDVFYSIDENGLWEQVEGYCYDEYNGIFKDEKPEWLDVEEFAILGEEGNLMYRYESNGTYKLDYADGLPVFEDRYYDVDFKGRYFFLLNADNEVYAIDPKGRQIADLGVFGMDKYGNIHLNGKEISDDEVYAGRDALYIVRETYSGYDVYRYSAP